MENILLTGASGFIGPLLAARLLQEGKYRLVLTDNVPPKAPAGAEHLQNVVCLTADLCNDDDVEKLVRASLPLKAVFILHGIMSAGSESNPELSENVNLNATKNLLRCVARHSPGARVLYSSSIAIYGQPFPDMVTDATTPTPQGTYGTHKFMTELLVNEMTRRGQIDGFSLRFPTISVRSGKPTQAASSFFSGMIREPMKGERCVMPISDRAFKVWLGGPKTLVENLVRMIDVPGNALPSHIRSVIMPGITVTIQEMMDALAVVGGEDKLAYLEEVDDPALAPLLRSWPAVVDCSTAMKMGLSRDASFEEMVREFKATMDCS